MDAHLDSLKTWLRFWNPRFCRKKKILLRFRWLHFIAFEQEEKTRQLHEASREGNAARVAQLLSEGARITGKDDMGYTALHWASLYGHVQGQVMGSVSTV
jgi:hypothetical protein